MQMTMQSNEGRKPLRSIASVLSPEDFAFIGKQALAISARLESRKPKFYAEVIDGVTPHWHVVMTHPGQERTAAAELADRGFGIYVPEKEFTEIRRGRKVDGKRLLLPGYVLTFVWGIDEHCDRIRACNGVRDILFINGHAALVPDWMVNQLRVEENRQRPLRTLVEVVTVKKRKRQSHKSIKEIDVHGNDIVSVHPYSPFIEAMRAETEGERLSAFHKALGLAA